MEPFSDFCNLFPYIIVVMRPPLLKHPWISMLPSQNCPGRFMLFALKFQHKLRMSHEPVFLEHVSTTSDLQGRFFESHPEQEGVFRDMEDPAFHVWRDKLSSIA